MKYRSVFYFICLKTENGNLKVCYIFVLFQTLQGSGLGCVQFPTEEGQFSCYFQQTCSKQKP